MNEENMIKSPVRYRTEDLVPGVCDCGYCDCIQDTGAITSFGLCSGCRTHLA